LEIKNTNPFPKNVAVSSLMGSARTRNKPVINRKNLIYLIWLTVQRCRLRRENE